MTKNTLKSLLKIANKLDRFGLTKEADLLDAIIYKMAANIIDPKTKQPVKMDPQLSTFLDSYIVNGSLKVPVKFSEWLLEGGAGAKKISNFFNPSLNSTWTDYGFQYIKTLPKLGSSIEFYLNLAQLVPGWNQDEADSTKQYDIKVIYKNLYDYNRGREDLMRSSKSYSTGEQIAHGVGSVVTSPYTSYQALQNPAVKKETKEFMNANTKAVTKNSSISEVAISLIVGMPLTFANGVIDLETGEYKSAILNFVEAFIGVLVAHFGGSLLKGIIPDPVKRYFYALGASMVLSDLVSETKNQILNSDLPEQKKEEMAKTEVLNAKFKPLVESKIKEVIGS